MPAVPGKGKPAMRRAAFLVIVLTMLVSTGPMVTLAQDATPATGVDDGMLATSATPRTDLAAMAFATEDLPPGCVNIDERYFLTAQGVSTFYFQQAVSAEEVAQTGLRSMYDSQYLANPADQRSDWVAIYIAEFDSPEAVEAGFALFEDESRIPEGIDVQASEDLPGPGLGESPSETTVALIDYRAVGGPYVNQVSVAFRVDRFLVSVILETDAEGDAGAAAATPVAPASASPAAGDAELRQVTALASTLLDRIDAVLAGEAVAGTDTSLPPLLLATDQAWPMPGVAAEGYKDPSQVLGSVGPAAELTDTFQGGYARTVAPGTGPDDLFPAPPFVTIGVSGYASADDSMGVFDAASGLPVPGPLPSPQVWEEVSTDTVADADASATYRSAFDPAGPVDSARVALVVGDQLITVDVQGAASEADAVAIAEDLAGQQASCVAAGGPCDTVTVPPALSAEGAG